MPHYRSVGSGNIPITGPAIGTPNASGVYMFPALQVVNGVFQPFHSSGAAFWQSPYAQSIDANVTVPLFKGDIVLRGGIARLLIGAYPENVNFRVKVYAVWAKATPDPDVYTNTNNQTRGVEFDPSLIPDFATKFGKILYEKEAMLPVGETFEIIHRFKPQKIDQNVYMGQDNVAGADEPAGSQLWWMVIIVPLDVNGISAAVTCVNSFNLSFSADAIGTT